MGPETKSSGEGLKPELKLRVMDGAQTAKTVGLRVEAGSSSEDAIRKLSPLVGLMNRETRWGIYTYGVDGKVVEGKPKDGDYPSVFPTGPNDYRTGKKGEGIEYFACKNGRYYLLRTIIDGKVYAVTLKNLIITEDTEIVAAVNCYCMEGTGGEQYLRYRQFENRAVPAMIDENTKVRIEDLVYDSEISPELFRPLPVSYRPARIGNEIRSIRWEAWAQFTIQTRIKPDNAPEDPRLTPELMRLAKELEAKNRRTKEMNGPSFTPMNFGFNSPGRGFDAPQNDEVDGFGWPGSDDAPSFGSAPAGGMDADKASKRPVPAGYAQKETPIRKMMERLGLKTSQAASTQSHMAETLVSAWQKIGEQAQAVLQGMKTGMAAAGTAAVEKQAEKESEPPVRRREMRDNGQAMQKYDQQQTVDLPSMRLPAPLSEGPLAFVQFESGSIGQAEHRTEMAIPQTAVQTQGEARPAAGAETAPDMPYQAGQTMTQVVQNQINAPVPVLPARFAAQVVAAEPVKMVVGKENKKEKEKIGINSVLVIITAPVLAKKKKNDIAVSGRFDIKTGGNKVKAMMENKKGGSCKKAA